MLDFWHACEHIHGTSRVWHGEGPRPPVGAEQAVRVMRARWCGPVGVVGQVTDEVVKEHIEHQGRGSDAEFGVKGDPG